MMNEFQSEQKYISLERASFGNRFFARFVDITMVSLSTWFLAMMISLISTSIINEILYTAIFIMIIVSIIQFYYFVFYPYKNNGQTLGKKWNKVKVVDLDGNNLPLWRFFVREFFSIFIIIIGNQFMGMLAYLWFLTYLLALTKEKRALHDIIAGTQVVKA